jgi:DNA polymerase elongation subunit (family B)
MAPKNGPKILLVDIEVMPMEVFCFDLYDPKLNHKNIVKDWSIISYAAQWVGESKVYYQDQRNAKDLRDEKKILQEIWDLINECDIFLGHNSEGFDFPKLNTRFIKHGFKPIKPDKHIDTLKMAKKHFKVSSNSLEYLLEFLECKNRKTKHEKYPGMSLFHALRSGEKGAWEELKKYNINDIAATRELYERIYPWSNHINFNLYTKELDIVCSCGSTEFVKNGFTWKESGKYQVYICVSCGARERGRVNLLSATKKDTLRKRV